MPARLPRFPVAFVTGRGTSLSAAALSQVRAPHLPIQRTREPPPIHPSMVFQSLQVRQVRRCHLIPTTAPLPILPKRVAWCRQSPSLTAGINPTLRIRIAPRNHLLDIPGRPPPLPCTLPETAIPQDTGIMRHPLSRIPPVYHSINPLPVMSISSTQIIPSVLILS